MEGLTLSSNLNVTHKWKGDLTEIVAGCEEEGSGSKNKRKTEDREYQLL